MADFLPDPRDVRDHPKVVAIDEQLYLLRRAIDSLLAQKEEVIKIHKDDLKIHNDTVTGMSFTFLQELQRLWVDTMVFIGSDPQDSREHVATVIYV